MRRLHQTILLASTLLFAGCFESGESDQGYFAIFRRFDTVDGKIEEVVEGLHEGGSFSAHGISDKPTENEIYIEYLKDSTFKLTGSDEFEIDDLPEILREAGKNIADTRVYIYRQNEHAPEFEKQLRRLIKMGVPDVRIRYFEDWGKPEPTP